MFVGKVRHVSMYRGTKKCIVYTSSNILYICELRVKMLKCIEKSKKICEKNDRKPLLATNMTIPMNVAC